MMAVGTSASAVNEVVEPHFFADLYRSDWTKLGVRLPLVSAAAVALCLFVGIAAGHPGGGLIAGGGAFTIGFGANQRIGDSRVQPMLLAIIALATATLAGAVAGHRGYAILMASGVSGAIYGLLTIRHAGLAWVGQQASMALFVSSAFPSGPRAALVRAGLTVVGGVVQLLFMSTALEMMPELRKDLIGVSLGVYRTLRERRRDLLQRLRHLPEALPTPDRKAAAIYGLRMMVTVVLASEVYRRLHMQSGYWVPMTALLVQKPAFYETLTRGLLRTAGTLAGATLATLLAAHVPLGNWWLAGLATTFAFWSFATISVNYGLYAVGLTSYIVFLLSLNALPGPAIAHRRFWCTAAGAGIALVFHLDALRRHKQTGVGV